MKLRKNWKRFWTLDRHHAEGFTLVELIVVIAILAILGGVAVPAYSGYVKKANMQADMSLISEIEQALWLAYYNQDLTEGSAGFIMLSPNAGESMADEEGATALALEKTFGANWRDQMQLKYDNWGVSWTTMSYEDANAIVNSGFTQNYTSDELMQQVQAMTDAVNGLSFQIGDTQIQLYNMFGYKDANGDSQNTIIETMKTYGLGETQADWEKLSATEKSNLLVLATANGISNGQQSNAATLIPQYALYTAYAAENAEFNEAYKTFQNTINNIDPNSADSEYEVIKNAYKTLQAAAGADFSTWAGDADDPNSNVSTNMSAFNAIMSGIGSAMDSNKDAILSDLGNAEMFTSGIGYDLYNDYLDAAYATAGNDDEIMEAFLVGELGENGVLVQYVVKNGMLYITNSMLLS